MDSTLIILGAGCSFKSGYPLANNSFPRLAQFRDSLGDEAVKLHGLVTQTLDLVKKLRKQGESSFNSLLLPISPSRTAHIGGTVATISFPDICLQGFSPKLAKGEIASLSGAADDARYFQISVPVQPGKVGVQALACWRGGGHAEA